MQSKQRQKTHSQSKYNDFFHQRPFEDSSLIQAIEGYLKKKKFPLPTTPRPDTKVILLFSGGIDSTVAWYLLVKKYKLVVYPIAILPRYHPSRLAVKSIANHFRQQFGQLFREPKIVTRTWLATEFTLNHTKIHPSQILELFDPKYNILTLFPGLNAMGFLDALNYAQHLRITQNVYVNHIFLGVLATDGILIRSQTQTFLRIVQLLVKFLYGDYQLEISSLFCESNTGAAFTKRDVIRLAARYQLPLNRTYSCYSGQLIHCGKCLSCSSRKHAFILSRTDDKTLYLDQIPPISFLMLIIQKLQNFYLKKVKKIVSLVKIKI